MTEQTSPSPMLSQKWERVWVGGILLIHLILAIGFSLGPLWEAPDEISHYRVIRIILEERSLPGPIAKPTYSSETDQAPLYYLISGLVAPFFPDPDFQETIGQLNPRQGYEFGVPNNDNKNLRLHFSGEVFPWSSPTALAVHILRLIPVLLGTAMSAACYLIFRQLWPDRPDRRLLALGMVAFWPQTLFISGTVNNDNMIIFGATLALLWLLRYSDNGPTLLGGVMLGIMGGLAVLSKANGVFLIFPIGAALILDRRTWRWLPLLGLVALLAGGWWYVRNLIALGEPTGYGLFYQLVPDQKIVPGTLSFAQWVSKQVYVYTGSWIYFGAGAVIVSDAVRWFFMIVFGAAAIGFGVWFVRAVREAREVRPSPETVRRVAIIGLFVLAWPASLGYIAATLTTGGTIRPLLPGIAGFAVLLTLGLTAIIPERFRLRAALSLVAAMALVAVVCMAGYFQLSYLPVPAPAQAAAPLGYRYGDQAELTGVSATMIRAQPGERIALETYWKALGPADTQEMTYLHSVESKVLRWDSFPGMGNLPSTDWKPGQTWTERHFITIKPNTPVQTVVTLVAGLYNPKTESVISATDASGAEVLPVVGRLAIHGPADPFDPDYRFGGLIGLARPEVKAGGGQVNTCLRWLSIKEVATSYHMYVHLFSKDGTLIGQTDYLPKGGQYPTDAWSAGERIEECVAVALPDDAGAGWYVTIGVYEPVSGGRLPVVDKAGAALANDEVVAKP